jgi:hypothetical protein
MSVGKDGKAFDLARWVNWASAPGNSHGLHVARKSEDDGRKRSTSKLKRQGGIRRACECGRMNPTRQGVCKCGKILRVGSKAISK